KELAELRKLLQDKAGQAQKLFTINVQGEPFRGDPAAGVGIMEFSDFECPYCGTYAREIYPKIEQEYVKPGKAKYFFRDLPAPEHLNALAAARAARCAGEQDRFWEMHDLLFKAQLGLAETNLVSYAQSLGLDAEKFNECLSSGRYTENIQLSAD